MEYEIMYVDGTFGFSYGVKELKATLKADDTRVITIWKNIKKNGTCEDVTDKYIHS